MKWQMAENLKTAGPWLCYKLHGEIFKYKFMAVYHLPTLHSLTVFKVCLHFGNYRSKLVHFESKKIFYVKKP